VAKIKKCDESSKADHFLKDAMHLSRIPKKLILVTHFIISNLDVSDWSGYNKQVNVKTIWTFFPSIRY
jgi:hypothetical protein